MAWSANVTKDEILEERVNWHLSNHEFPMGAQGADVSLRFYQLAKSRGFSKLTITDHAANMIAQRINDDLIHFLNKVVEHEGFVIAPEIILQHLAESDKLISRSWREHATPVHRDFQHPMSLSVWNNHSTPFEPDHQHIVMSLLEEEQLLLGNILQQK